MFIKRRSRKLCDTIEVTLIYNSNKSSDCFGTYYKFTTEKVKSTGCLVQIWEGKNKSGSPKTGDNPRISQTAKNGGANF